MYEIIKSEECFLNETSTCRDGTLKNQLNQMGMTPQHLHHPYLVPICLLCTPQISLHVHWPIHTNCITTNQQALLTQQPSAQMTTHMCHVQQKQKVHNITDTPTCHTDFSTAHALHSFCIQDWSYSPCSVATALQPSTTYLTSHAHQHVLHTQHYPPHFLCTQLTQGIATCNVLLLQEGKLKHVLQRQDKLPACT